MITIKTKLDPRITRGGTVETYYGRYHTPELAE